MTQPVRSSEQPGDTERLLFRRLRADDIELRLDLDSDPEVMRFLTGGRARTAEYEQAVVARSWTNTCAGSGRCARRSSG
jgi:RimJ/RimL family protein N-acetyltransferase